MRAHHQPDALAAREKLLRERAVLRAAVVDALARGFVIDPGHRARADRALIMNIALRRRRRSTHLVPVSPEFIVEHRHLIEHPHELWAVADD